MKTLSAVVSNSASGHSSVTKPAVLLVGCTEADRDTIAEVLPGARLIEAARDQALEQMRAHAPALAIVAIARAPKRGKDFAGVEILSLLVRERQAALIAALCRADDQEHATSAVAAGACDVLDTLGSATSLRHLLAQAERLARYFRRSRSDAPEASNRPDLAGVIGASAAMTALARQIRRIGPTDTSVLLSGESGTGKEVLARALHATSLRAKRAFVPINCAAIPETLLEAELFGYERGAFTGAVKQTPGRIELAHRGTLFLDEIGDLPTALQAKLLRFLQERVIERIGGRVEIALDVRIVCATHRDLAALIRGGQFREDLFYRLAEIALRIPPLRERPGDAILLAKHYAQQYASAALAPAREFTGSALASLDRHSWPGNVRELQNRVKRAAIMADGPRMTASDLDLEEENGQPDELNLRRNRERVEHALLQRALARSDGNLTAAARLLGVSRPTLYDLLRQHRLRP